jgi:GNAT superfamily N-acetyltransferase
MTAVADLRPIALTVDSIPGGLALSTEAGWNQIDQDWRFMLASGSSFGYVAGDGRLVASGLTVDFPGYAWISMILVTPAWRRQGLATRLMQSCVAALQARQLVPALDASPEGREVYLRLGFRDCGSLTRLAGDLTTGDHPGGGDIQAMAAADLPGVVAYDTKSSGTDRAALLQHLHGRLPGAALLARRNGRIAGFVMARNGRLSAQIGPLMADDDETATALLAGAGRAIGGPVCLDLFDQRTAMRGWLEKNGCVAVTRFVRMVLSPQDIFPSGHRVYAIAGPELG